MMGIQWFSVQKLVEQMVSYFLKPLGATLILELDIFYPIQVVATYTWSKNSNSPRNYFDLNHSEEVDYDDEVDYSDEEIDDHESDGNPESVAHAQGNVINNFSVPESDISDDVVSIISNDDPMSDQESPTSSLIGSIQREDNKENEIPPPRMDRVSYSPHPIDQSSPALGDHATDDKDSDGDSYHEDSSIFDGDEEIQAHIGDVLEFSPQPSASEADDEFLTGGGPFYAPGFSLPSLGRPAREPSPSDAAMVKPADRPLSPPALVRTLPLLYPMQSSQPTRPINLPLPISSLLHGSLIQFQRAPVPGLGIILFFTSHSTTPLFRTHTSTITLGILLRITKLCVGHGTL